METAAQSITIPPTPFEYRSGCFRLTSDDGNRLAEHEANTGSADLQYRWMPGSNGISTQANGI